MFGTHIAVGENTKSGSRLAHAVLHFFFTPGHYAGQDIYRFTQISFKIGNNKKEGKEIGSAKIVWIRR